MWESRVNTTVSVSFVVLVFSRRIGETGGRGGGGGSGGGGGGGEGAGCG